MSSHSSPHPPRGASGLDAASAWIPSAVLLSAVAACALGLAAEAASPPPETPARAVRPRTPGRAVELAGSGSNVPLTRALARAWSAGRPDRQAVVHESVGSGGGLRALRDGAVDVAMVSRPLRASETRGMRAVRYATTEVVLAANTGVRARALSPAALLEVLRGSRTRWDDGSPLRFITREAGDSSHLALAARLPGFSEAEDGALRSRRFMMATSDDDLRDALVETSGALGVTDLGGMRLHGRPLARVALDLGAPVTKDLTLVFAARPRAEVEDFVAFVRSPEGRTLARESGYTAPEGP